MAKESAETARKAVVYNIESASPSAVSSAVSVLTTIYPNARFVAGTDPGKLVAHARPAEHAEIKKTIDQLAREGPAGDGAADGDLHAGIGGPGGRCRRHGHALHGFPRCEVRAQRGAGKTRGLGKAGGPCGDQESD